MFDETYITVRCNNPDVDIFHLAEQFRNKFKGCKICTEVDYHMLPQESEYDYSKILTRDIVVKSLGLWFKGDDSQSEHLEYLSEMSSQFSENDDVVVSLIYSDYDEVDGDIERNISFKCGERVSVII